MAFANCEVQGRRVVVLASEQRRTACGQFLHAIQITIPACREHVPHIRGRGDNAVVKLHRPRFFHFTWLNHMTPFRSNAAERKSHLPGRLQRLHTSKNRDAGPVCCNDWFGLETSNIPDPPFTFPLWTCGIPPPPSFVAFRGLPSRTGTRFPGSSH